MTENSALTDRKSIPSAISDVVVANHILYNEGVLDAWGHISVRDPERTDRFWLSRSLAPAQVTVEDLMEFDLESKAVDQRGRKLYLERFIHGEIYRMRPDVMSVLHNHSPALISFSVTDVPLRPLTSSAGFLGMGVPNFDIRSVDDGPVMIIVNSEQGKALADALGDHAVCLLARHGAVIVGDSVRQTVWRGVHSESNARMQMDATRLGNVKYLSPAEAAYAAKHVPPDKERAWNHWAASIKGGINQRHDQHNTHAS